MPDPKIVDFKPRWMREMSERDREILSETPLTGSRPLTSPRIVTRVSSANGLSGISSRRLVSLLQLTQAIVSHSGCDLYYGFDAKFSDLRTVSAEVVQLTQLTVEPGEDGSFVLPARLDAPPAEVVEAHSRRSVCTDDVVRRFSEILERASDVERAAQVSLGALRAIEQLESLVHQEDAQIEYRPVNAEGQTLRAARVDATYLEAVKKVRETRQTTRTLLETLEGKITAIDLVEETLHFSLEGSTRRVKGSFSRLLHPALELRLGKRARLQGLVKRRGRDIVSILVQHVEAVGDE